jgi:hypothetical protein
MLKAIRAVVHNNATPATAYDLFQTLKNEK